MKADEAAPKNIDEYIAASRPEVQPILEKVRLTIRKAAPDAKEKICYRMPTFTLEGNLVHFAAFKEHLGLYPPVHGDEKLMREVSVYAGPKGNLRFPLAEPMPYGLIRRVVKARVQENVHRAEQRRTKATRRRQAR